MSRKPQAKVALESFEEALQSSEDLFNSVFKFINPTLSKKSTQPIAPKQAEQIIGFAFMYTISAWEEFLHDSFIRYMAGASSPSGFAPTLRLGKTNSLSHSVDIIGGEDDFNLDKKYLTWSSYQDVQSKAKIFFLNGAPYINPSITNNIIERIQDAQKIRNRLAHKSDKCVAEFIKVYCQITGHPARTPVPNGTDACRLLCAKPPHWPLPHPSGPTGAYNTTFEAYIATFRHTARLIVPR